MMKMLTDFNVMQKFSFVSQTLIGTLLSMPFITPVTAQEIGGSFHLPNRQIQLPVLSESKPVEDIGFRSTAAAAMLNMINIDHKKNLLYINASNLTDNSYRLNFSTIKENVTQKNNRYLIDFTSIENEEKKNIAKSILKNILGVSFPSDFLVIGLYKGELIYTPFGKENDHLLQMALSRNSETSAALHARSAVQRASGETMTLPHVAFYMDVNRPISDRECTFPVSHIWERGQRVFCEKANIALIYRVNLMRSLTHGNIGSATPDAKLVRISLDGDSAGAGIQLNSRIDVNSEAPGYKFVDGWHRSYATDAIAKDYKFSVSASNNTAAILKTFPTSNLNVDYENRDSSGFDIGVTAGPEVGIDSAKAKLEAKYNYSQSRILVYKTQDYRVERSAPNAQSVSFTWARETAPTAESMLSKHTATIWGDSHPIDFKHIKPISHQGFVPNFDVIYKADPNARGSTKFTINSSVNIWPVYTAAYKHYYVVGGHLSFQGQEGWQKYRRVEAPISFDVEWNHPVFSGGRPVNLQLGGFNNKCISYADNAKLEIADCDLKSTTQSFIYDQLGRYMSAADTGKCLDLNNLSAFQSCNTSLSQRWKWIGNSDQLQNEYQGQYLAHDIQNESIIPAPQESENIKLRTLTKFTDIYAL